MSDKITKYERVASAMYLITSFFDDKEPLKWKLRSLAADLVSEAQNKSKIVTEILSLFSIAKTSALISDSNYEILSRELNKIEIENSKNLEHIFPAESSINDRSIAITTVPKIETRAIKDNIIEKPSLKEFGAVSVKKNNRQSIIISILKRKKEIMIKDVFPLIEGYSEKTIQRELSAMVKAGIIKKTGEKRWSRYTLAE